MENCYRKKELIGAWLSADVKEIVEKLASARGVSISEYIRELILKDLDKRALLGPFHLEKEASGFGKKE